MRCAIFVALVVLASCGAARTDAGVACPEPSSACTEGAAFCDPSSRARAWVCVSGSWAIVACGSKLAPYYEGDARAGCAGTSEGSQCFGPVCK